MLHKTAQVYLAEWIRTVILKILQRTCRSQCHPNSATNLLWLGHLYSPLFLYIYIKKDNSNDSFSYRNIGKCYELQFSQHWIHVKHLVNTECYHQCLFVWLSVLTAEERTRESYFIRDRTRTETRSIFTSRSPCHNCRFQHSPGSPETVESHKDVVLRDMV